MAERKVKKDKVRRSSVRCDHAPSDDVDMLSRIDIKNYETRQLTCIFRYRCWVHPGGTGIYTAHSSF